MNMNTIKNAFSSTVIGISIVYMAYILMFILMFSFGAMSTWDVFEVKRDSLTYDPIPFLVVATFPMIIGLIALPIIFEWKFFNCNMKDLGLRVKSENKWVANITYFIGGVLIICIIILNLQTAFPVLVHYTVSCFGEELLFRGILQKRMTDNMNSIIAILLCAIIFSVGFHQDSNLVDNLIIRFPLGFILGLIYHKTKSLFPSTTLHLAYNMFVSF
ncbi:CPBP family intramembrane metalloprotease [Bacillus spizizenii]|nr:CPBP family intramembrane metalloprotease [Bacillus spizizenii]MCY8166583.1 CPBP family intramembrane metalloprotease [Bacillus spizizenii]MCY8189742.1 CPBP family intramembrane metalloprotease [Bacillus spizizenii]MCY8226966.1 CPBP family intramembrane metalloprotease [Bacillus spizizenii]MCY8394177.1 CPBP family intramembrane metalloprotease [Bacillus spizizenii]